MKVVYIILVKVVKIDMLIKEVTKRKILDRVEWRRQKHVIENELIMTILNWNRILMGAVFCTSKNNLIV